MLLLLIKINLIIAFITDYSGVTDYINRGVYKMITKRDWNGQSLKLISCSLCQSFWITIIVLSILHTSFINILLFAVINAYTVQYYTQILYILQTNINKLLNKLC